MYFLPLLQGHGDLWKNVILSKISHDLVRGHANDGSFNERILVHHESRHGIKEVSMDCIEGVKLRQVHVPIAVPTKRLPALRRPLPDGNQIPPQARLRRHRTGRKRIPGYRVPVRHARI